MFGIEIKGLKNIDWTGVVCITLFVGFLIGLAGFKIAEAIYT